MVAQSRVVQGLSWGTELPYALIMKTYTVLGFTGPYTMESQFYC